MHMSDALISPQVGLSMAAVSAGAVAFASRRFRGQAEEGQIPLSMAGVLGAFVFAAQMINFAVPGTGSSGHLGGGLLLGLLLGPSVGLLTMTALLTVQAFVFADGGILALGCNIFNLGVVPVVLVGSLLRPLVIRCERPLVTGVLVIVGALLSAQLGAGLVTAQTTLSGNIALPLGPFALAMLGIHLPIGLVEGLATLAILKGAERIVPMWFHSGLTVGTASTRSLVSGISIFGGLALLIGCLGCWFASALPDGLEWSVERTASAPASHTGIDTPLHQFFSQLSAKLALLPDYDFARTSEAAAPAAGQLSNAGASLSGLLGTAGTVVIVVLIGWSLRGFRRRQSARF